MPCNSKCPQKSDFKLRLLRALLYRLDFINLISHFWEHRKILEITYARDAERPFIDKCIIFCLCLWQNLLLYGRKLLADVAFFFLFGIMKVESLYSALGD